MGACPNCRGFGKTIGLDLKKAIPNGSLSLKQGAIKPFQSERGAECQRDLLRTAKKEGIPLDQAWQELGAQEQHWVLEGAGKKPAEISSSAHSQKRWETGEWYGVRGFFDWMESRSYKMHVRVFLSQYRSYTDCPVCEGKRLHPQALAFTIHGKSLPELWQMPLNELMAFIHALRTEYGATQIKSNRSLQVALNETESRLRYLQQVGLSYLTLDRAANTLSGGEIARVNLTTCLGTSLTDTLFVLDEPTIGLHAGDIERLVELTQKLRDQGNTLVVVEHDAYFMRAADHLLEMGPFSGEKGGEIVYQGPPPTQDVESTQTHAYLRGKLKITRQAPKRQKKAASLRITGARCHNLMGLSVCIPLRKLVALTGVSGSGKSTLAHEVLYRNLALHLGQNCSNKPAFVKTLTGAEKIKAVEIIDQTPLSRTPRSTPAVLLGAFTVIRELLVLKIREEHLTEEVIKPGFFSFNSGQGRCTRCGGMGFEKVEMQFLSDLFLRCADCNGKRFSAEALQFTYREKNVAELLELTAEDALDFFAEQEGQSPKEKTLLRKLHTCLNPLQETGLGYLRLGQAVNTLSGGESQRLKLCQLLARQKKSNNATKASDKTTLLILDEPTTGLHFSDIQNLIRVFERLLAEGHSLLVIEHHLDIIQCADTIIELGPKGGKEGGQVVFTGSPEEILQTETQTGQALCKEQVQKKKNSWKKSPRGGKFRRTSAIQISGARHHNLKNIDLDIPREQVVVISGRSGSGKSTIAFDILFAEGQRRFLDSMSPYARQMVEQLERPDVDQVVALPPTVAIQQRMTRGGQKSTVATVTELYHFLRLLYAKLAVQFCPASGEAVVSQSKDSILNQLLEIQKKGEDFRLLAPVVRWRKGYHTDVAERALRIGCEELLVDDAWVLASEFQALARYREHDIDFVLLHNTDKTKHSLAALKESLQKALRLGGGTVRVFSTSEGEKEGLRVYSTARVSPVTGQSFEEPDPVHLSFNSPRGWCETCRGYGRLQDTHEKKLPSRYKESHSLAEAELMEETARRNSKEEQGSRLCPSCHGERLKESARYLKLYFSGKTGWLSLPQLCALNVTQAGSVLEKLALSEERAQMIARDILPELRQRLHFLQEVGLGYLELNRTARTLSGGENQRTRLAAQLGSNLCGVLYILDEPTIGLHPRDHRVLLTALRRLRQKGNSLLIVEHDEETILGSDHLIDLGPEAGSYGGQVVFEGNPLKALTQHKEATSSSPSQTSPTLQALAKPSLRPSRGTRRKLPALNSKDGWLRLKGCSLYNLKKINARLPLHCLTVITGVSGSGKSAFMRGCLKVAAQQVTQRKQASSRHLQQELPYTSAEGFEALQNCYEVDQSPIGKTTRSCPVTYIKVFERIRQVFAQLPQARMRGYTPTRFSFNNKEGQCPECKGQGKKKMEMSFLPTSWVSCDRCEEKRYNPSTLDVLYQGLSIGDVLEMTVEQAMEFFHAHPQIKRPLELMKETGLGYLQLGQPSTTLSGGEAQRLKLVSELVRGRTSVRKMATNQNNLYLIEEPTVGLHLLDIELLIETLHQLVDEGHTVVVIEHHQSLVAEADYHLDIGPEAGAAGGRLVAQGRPETTAKNQKSHTAPFLAAALRGEMLKTTQSSATGNQQREKP